MPVSRGMKRTNHIRQAYGSSSTMEALPKELLMEVLKRVASASVSDLNKAKLICRDFLDAAENDYIYQHVSMEKFPLIPWFISDKEFSFLKRCRESGNSESLYREGMVEYFSSLKVNSGLENLKMAAQNGHKEAKYVYAVILMCSEDEELRKQGLEILRFLRISKCVRKCRKKVERFIWSMWVKNRAVRNRQPLCCFRACGGHGRLQTISGGWPSVNEEEDDDVDMSCEYCRGDHELNLFCKMLKV